MTTTNRSDIAPTVASSVFPRVPVTEDSRGHVRVAKEQRKVILDEFGRSGVSAARFAKRTGIKYSTFAGWLQRYRRPKRSRRPRPLRLLEAVVEPAPQPWAAVVLQLPGGASLEVADKKQAVLAAVLVHALAKSC